MKRYLMLGHWHESDGEKRRAGRDKNFYPVGEGRIIVAGDIEREGFFSVVECEGPVEARARKYQELEESVRLC